MKRLLNIMADKRYQAHCDKIANHEIDREYCHHDFSHFLEVARVSYILYLERLDEMGPMPNAKELIYATALLHDIGKFCQYENECIDHAVASAELALPILRDAGYNDKEINIILKGIKKHREPSDDGFSMLIYDGDKLSRPCMFCKVKDSCKKKSENWFDKTIEY